MGTERQEPLEKLLAGASDADGMDRMGFRDRIATHGAAAVASLTPWLDDPDRRAFAIRTIARAGRIPEAKDAAVAALFSVRDAAPAYLQRDIDEALATLGPVRKPRASRAAPKLDADGQPIAPKPRAATTRKPTDNKMQLVGRGESRRGLAITYTIQAHKGGHFYVPASVRQELGVEEGGEIHLVVRSVGGRWEGVVELQPGDEVFPRPQDPGTKGLEVVKYRETITVTASRAYGGPDAAAGAGADAIGEDAS